MVKRKTLGKRGVSSPITKQFVKVDESKFKPYDPSVFLLNRDNILMAIAECVEAKDLDGVMEMIRIYRGAVRRAKLFGNSEAISTSSTSSSHKKSDIQGGNSRPALNARSVRGRSKKVI